MAIGNKVWFVTGASSGFGRAIAEEVVARGEKVDVTRPEQIGEAVASADARFAAIDVLVNNAGYSMVGAVEETSDDELRAIADAVEPQMRERRTGTIAPSSPASPQRWTGTRRRPATRRSDRRSHRVSLARRFDRAYPLRGHDGEVAVEMGKEVATPRGLPA